MFVCEQSAEKMGHQELHGNGKFRWVILNADYIGRLGLLLNK